MAYEAIFATTSVTHGTTTLEGATHFSCSAVAAVMEDNNTKGLAEQRVANRRINVTVWGKDPSQLDALAEAAAANLIVVCVKTAGAAMTITIKNVVFNAPCDINSPMIDQGGNVPTFPMNGVAEWGAADTWALMRAIT